MGESLRTSKIVKKWGTSLVIVLNKEDTEILRLDAGDVLDLQIIKIKPEEVRD